MEVDGDEEQHLSKTDPIDALSPQNHKTKHPLQTLWMSSKNNRPLTKKFEANKSWPPYFFGGQNLRSYFDFEKVILT